MHHLSKPMNLQLSSLRRIQIYLHQKMPMCAGITLIFIIDIRVTLMYIEKNPNVTGISFIPNVLRSSHTVRQRQRFLMSFLLQWGQSVQTVQQQQRQHFPATTIGLHCNKWSYSHCAAAAVAKNSICCCRCRTEWGWNLFTCGTIAAAAAV